MIDLQKLQESLSDEKIIELVTELGADSYEEKSDCIIFPTICHNKDSSTAKKKLYYYKKNKSFHCYTDCGCNFNIYNLFVKRYELLDIPFNYYKDIILKISQNVKIDELDDFSTQYISDFEKYKKSIPNVDLTELSPNILNRYSDFYTPEWLEDGISVEAMKQFNIKYSIPQNKIIIPHYDKDGRLIGIRGRALNPDDIAIGKYMPIMEGDHIFTHPLGYNLYGLNYNKENIKEKKIVFVAESEKSVLQYETMFGRKNNVMVAVCGSNFSQYQFSLLKDLNITKIIIAFDKEGDSWDAQEKYQKKLKKICKKFSNFCNIGFLWDSKNLLQLKDSPTDKGKEIFLRLYNEGVVWVR